MLPRRRRREVVEELVPIARAAAGGAVARRRGHARRSRRRRAPTKLSAAFAAAVLRSEERGGQTVRKSKGFRYQGRQQRAERLLGRPANPKPRVYLKSPRTSDGRHGQCFANPKARGWVRLKDQMGCAGASPTRRRYRGTGLARPPLRKNGREPPVCKMQASHMNGRDWRAPSRHPAHRSDPSARGKVARIGALPRVDLSRRARGIAY